MKHSVVLAVLCTIAVATTVEQEFSHVQETPFATGDKSHLEKQKNILRLFKHIDQPSYYKDHVEIAKTYSIEKNLMHYSDPKAVDEFLYYYHTDILPKEYIFSVFHKVHMSQAIALFKVFYYAKDYNTLYKTAVWARNHVNPGLFLYSFSIAVLHHPATYGIMLPAIHEIYPFYFYNYQIISKAQQYKQKYRNKQPSEHDGFVDYTIYANYSGFYLNKGPLSYYTEDVGINAFYYYYNLYRPFWTTYEAIFVNSLDRGEDFYYFCQQFLARYYLERLSNDLGEIPHYDYKHPQVDGYTPSLGYPNGLAFPVRHKQAQLDTEGYSYGQNYSTKIPFSYSYKRIKNYEHRILMAIDFSYARTEQIKGVNLYESEDINTLGNLIEGNLDSINLPLYGNIQLIARHLLGYAKLPLGSYKVTPSTLGHFETSLRDPAFYQLYKQIVLYFQEYKSRLTPYTHDDLVFPGVKIESVHVDPLVTYFESVDADITNAVYVDEQEFETEPFRVRVRQQRLNHLPFDCKIEVVSEKAVDAVVRVFIGPKHNEHGRHIDINENRVNFVELHRFTHHLNAGKNVIEHKSHKNYFSKDYPTYQHIHQAVDSASKDNETFLVFGTEAHYAFPERYLLPKGKRGGQTYQLYVIISKYKPITEENHQHYKAYARQQQVYHEECYRQQGQQPKQVQYYPLVGLGVTQVDAYPLGYPFDRPVGQHASVSVPNSYFQDVVIDHKSESELF